MHEAAVRGGTLVTPWAVETADIGIDAGRISAIRRGLRGRREINASGCVVLPGAIDAHTHMDLPVSGTRSSDDFRTGTEAAACGGVTTIIDFTAGGPGASLPDAIARRRNEAAAAVIDYALHAEVVGWRADRAGELDEAIAAGVTSFKFYTAYESSGRRTPYPLLRGAFAALAARGATALVHAEDEGLISSIEQQLDTDALARMSTLADARPDLCEQTAISTVVRAARETGCRTHIVHVSSARGLAALATGRESGALLSAETCPQYLLLTRGVYDRPDGHLFSATPALRTDGDREALWNGLRRGGPLDLVATDHCPFTRAQKAWPGDFRRLPYGLPGVETLLPLLHSEGVASGLLTLPDLPRLLSDGPARVFGLRPAKGSAEIGADADLVVFDPNARWRISASMLHMKTDFSPYEGRDVVGRVRATLSRGELVHCDGEPLGVAGRGRFIERRLAVG